jgi:hypothetical protein
MIGATETGARNRHHEVSRSPKRKFGAMFFIASLLTVVFWFLGAAAVRCLRHAKLFVSIGFLFQKNTGHHADMMPKSSAV